MRRTKIGIFTIIFALLLSISMNGFAVGKDFIDIDTIDRKEITNVKISLSGKPLNIPSEYGYSFLDNQSRTMIPLRIISERLGHKVEWDQATKTAIIDGSVSITIGENVVNTPNGEIVMDTKAILKDTRTYVPLRFVVEALGYEVTYDGPKASNGHNHMVDIFKEGSSGNVGQGDGTILDPSKNFLNDKALNDFFAKYPKENVVISSKGVQFDSTGGVHSGLTAIWLINELETSGHYSLEIKHYDNTEQEGLEYLLKNIAGQEAGGKLQDWIYADMKVGHTWAEVDTWVKMTDEVELYRDYANQPSIGVLYYIRPIK